MAKTPEERFLEKIFGPQRVGSGRPSGSGTGTAVAKPVSPEEIQKMLSPLDEREQEVLRLRFGLDRSQPRTLKEVAAQFDLTIDRVRQIEAQALSKLRYPEATGGKPDLIDTVWR